MIAKLVVAGVGLIGGSLALALREAGAVQTVVGVGRSKENLDAARARRILDRGYTADQPWAHEVRDADMVVIAAPVAQFAALFAAIAPQLGPDGVVTDAGSSKQDVIASARDLLGSAIARFVPAHPIAGSERSGAAAADACLFRERNVVVTPIAETDSAALERVESMWRATGASITRLDPAQHDRMLAAISHLPHVLAHTLVAELAARGDAPMLFNLAGTGFRDFTRIAASSPEMWRDIALGNRDALLEEIGAFADALAGVRAAISAGDGAAIEALFARAREARLALDAGSRGSNGQ